jgi:biopolymer transport protein ExbD
VHLRSRPQPAFEAINVTPLIDVVMVLIVFFLLVGQLASSEAAGVRLPVSVTGEGEENLRAVVVNIARAGEPAAPGRPGPVRYLVAGAEVATTPGTPTPGLEDRLQEAILRRARELAPALAPDTAPERVPVVVRADRRLAYGQVEPVLRAARRAGFGGVRLGTERTP